jgi:xanthine/uracil permease
VGGSPTTTYAENIGVMAATRVYSTAAYYVAALVAILFGLSPKFGAKIWKENDVDFANPGVAATTWWLPAS